MKEALASEYNHKKYFTVSANHDQEIKDRQLTWTELSLSTIWKQFIQVMIDIINDISRINQSTLLTDMITIFVRDDRLIYSGLLLLIIALFLCIIFF